MKRGRPPPIHEPLRCGGCHEFPQARNGVLNLDRCRCGAAWHIELLDDAAELGVLYF